MLPSLASLSLDPDRASLEFELGDSRGVKSRGGSALLVNARPRPCCPEGRATPTAFPTWEIIRWEERVDATDKRDKGVRKTHLPKTIKHEMQKRKTRENIESDSTVHCEICLQPPNAPPDLPNLPPEARALVEKSTTPKWGVFCNNGHAYHWFCMAPLLKTEQGCPECRQPPVSGLRDTLDSLPRLMASSPPPGGWALTNIDEAVNSVKDVIKQMTTPVAAESLSEDEPVVFRDWESGVLLMKAWPDGEEHHYEGGRGQEHLVQVVKPNGEQWEYEGGRGQEHLVQVVKPNGETWHYEGAKDEECKVMTVFPDGETWHYEGEKDEESKVLTVFPNGEKWRYDGEKDVERKWLTVFPNGEQWFYEGGKDVERKWLTVFPNGEQWFYEGEKDEEQIWYKDPGGLAPLQTEPPNAERRVEGATLEREM